MQPRRNELRFDMADAEFTHRGDQCSLEVLLAQSGRREPALQAIAEIVHDLDLKDGKFGRPEVEGLRQLLSGIALASANDNTRLDRGGMLFDDLYRSLQGEPATTANACLTQGRKPCPPRSMPSNDQHLRFRCRSMRRSSTAFPSG